MPVLAGGNIGCIFNTFILNGFLFYGLERSVLIALSCPSLRALKALYRGEMISFPFQCGVKGLANSCAAFSSRRAEEPWCPAPGLLHPEPERGGTGTS